jgi:hypothetical protein
MINRCRYCGDICPDFSTVCDSCCFIESEDNPNYTPTARKNKVYIEENEESPGYVPEEMEMEEDEEF